MSHTTTAAFDTTLQTTNVWPAELMQQPGWDDRRRAYLASRAVLQALRDRLCIDDAVAFGAQLPMLVRGFYYEGWHPAGKPNKDRKVEDFLAHVKENLHSDGKIDAEQTTRAVFGLLEKHITNGEIESLKTVLPHDLQALWP